MATLATSIESAPRVSRAAAAALRRLGVKTAQDLLFHFPARYDEFPPPKPIADIRAGEIATIEGAIEKISERMSAQKRMRLTDAAIRDATGVIQAVWFNQPYLTRNLKAGQRLRLSGKVSLGPRRAPALQNPAYERIGRQKDGAPDPEPIHTAGLVPVYPETRGITSRWIRFLVRSLLPLAASMPDPLPEETRSRLALPRLYDALAHIHFPETRGQAERARRRFMTEELILLQLRALCERSRLKQAPAPAIPFDIKLIKQFVASLPFTLTDAQRRAIWEIGRDMARSSPMNRLLEGDVGSGKTVVAAAASLLATRAGCRVAYMAPTEILATQHYATFQEVLAPFSLGIGLLTGSKKKIAGTPDIIIGTHALLYPMRNKTPKTPAHPLSADRASDGSQKDARPKGIGLVIVDEQHRFGVRQRAALLRHGKPDAGSLKEKTNSIPYDSRSMVPHFLSMTATPIPRTLALAAYGDLDLSLLDEMPKNRKEIITKIVEPARREETYQFIRNQVQQGRQAFVICPRIEVRPAMRLGRTSMRPAQQALLLADEKTVTEEYKKLSEFIFPDLGIAMLHGKMKPKEKAAAMKKFTDRETDVLVSTSVVEVGVDIPNATVMMIEGAERFGLAQLHQFRGRVGRGAEQSYCLLFPAEDGLASRRLGAVVEAKNGFELAELDFKIRGPGDIFGARQWGEPGMAAQGIANPALVRAAREEATALIKKSPNLSAYPELAARLAETEKTLHLE